MKIGFDEYLFIYPILFFKCIVGILNFFMVIGQNGKKKF